MPPPSIPTRTSADRSRLVALVLAVLVVAALPATGLSASSVIDPLDDGSGFWIQGEGPDRVRDNDLRTEVIAPTAAQERLAADLGATAIRWNRFGTPHVMVNHGGYLSGPRDGAAADVARAFVRDHADLFRFDDADVDALEVVRESPLYDAPDLAPVIRDGAEPANPDVATVVLFQQTFGDLPAAWDGLLTVGVQHDGRVAWVSSSVTGDDEVQGLERLSPVQAIQAAAADVGFEVGALSLVEELTATTDWITFDSAFVDDVQRARLMALPTPGEGVRLVWEVTLLQSEHGGHANDDVHGHAHPPVAFISFVDAEDGRVWLRNNRVDHLADDLPASFGDATTEVRRTAEDMTAAATLFQPRWRVFPTNPKFVTDDDPSEDTRELWCWTPGEGCDDVMINTASRIPWDSQLSGIGTQTTDGNNATAAISEASFLTPDTIFRRPVSATRNYDYEWNNTWFESQCDPTVFDLPGGNDDDASTTNLWAMHNRMHDWSYYLGFTELNSNLQQHNFGATGPQRETDPEIGNAQAGRRTFNGRDNANQITLQDGIPGITNQYLWQPLAGAFYGTCTDGAYDMAIVAHEYMHAITNRMIGGPNTGTGGSQGQTESWSDLAFAEYFRGFGLEASPDANPFALAPYVTGDLEAGIRNYAMNDSPLNYGNLDYDANGIGSPHANGEIWSAVNFDISLILNETYDDRFPSDDLSLQRRCALGELAADACPGNRRWAQLMFDGFLLQPSGSTMIDSRDGMLAADVLRFGGANQADLWEGFAARGLGEDASSTGTNDRSAVPSFASPEREDEAQIAFRAQNRGEGIPDEVKVHVGHYEARAHVLATTEGAKPTERTAFVPGTYDFIATAPGYGAVRFTETFAAGEDRVVQIPMRRNVASVHNGASATGDGLNAESLIDDTETTNWASLTSAGTASEGKGEGRQVEGRQVTVALEGDGPHTVREIQVSAALRPAMSGNPDSGGQNRFSALRSFDLLTCDASTGADCDSDEGYTAAYASPDDAFPAARPRPEAPKLSLRTFTLDEPVRATHVRFVVRDSQCTGAPDYTNEANPVNDPVFSNPDCSSEASTPDRQVLNPPRQQVRASELQVFTSTR
jgi:extracellular elastinolytic metalloproteinase